MKKIVDRGKVINLLRKGYSITEVANICRVSHQTICNIFTEVTGLRSIKGWREREGLMKICMLCGRVIKRPSLNVHFCSKRCYLIYVEYDWKTERKCLHCGRLFFPYRNWKYTRATADYCSQRCYLTDRIESGELSKYFHRKFNSKLKSKRKEVKTDA